MTSIYVMKISIVSSHVRTRPFHAMIYITTGTNGVRTEYELADEAIRTRPFNTMIYIKTGTKGLRTRVLCDAKKLHIIQ